MQKRCFGFEFEEGNFCQISSVFFSLSIIRFNFKHLLASRACSPYFPSISYWKIQRRRVWWTVNALHKKVGEESEYGFHSPSEHLLFTHHWCVFSALCAPFMFSSNRLEPAIQHNTSVCIRFIRCLLFSSQKSTAASCVRPATWFFCSSFFSSFSITRKFVSRKRSCVSSIPFLFSNAVHAVHPVLRIWPGVVLAWFLSSKHPLATSILRTLQNLFYFVVYYCTLCSSFFPVFPFREKKERRKKFKDWKRLVMSVSGASRFWGLLWNRKRQWKKARATKVLFLSFATKCRLFYPATARMTTKWLHSLLLLFVCGFIPPHISFHSHRLFRTRHAAKMRRFTWQFSLCCCVWRP